MRRSFIEPVKSFISRLEHFPVFVSKARYHWAEAVMGASLPGVALFLVTSFWGLSHYWLLLVFLAAFIFAAYFAWRDEYIRSSLGPRATIRKVFEHNRVTLLITNHGSVAEFHGRMWVNKGMVTSPSRYKGDLYCQWSHTKQLKTKIAKGETCRIVVAELVQNMPFLQWHLCAANEDGPLDIRSHYSAAIQAEGQAFFEIGIEGQIIADPDLVNGIQSFDFGLGPDAPIDWSL